MDLVNRIGAVTSYGATWVLWLLVALSIIALGVVLERAVVFVTSRDDVTRLRRDLRGFLSKGDLQQARRRLDASPSFEARVAMVRSQVEIFDSPRVSTRLSAPRARTKTSCATSSTSAGQVTSKRPQRA